MACLASTSSMRTVSSESAAVNNYTNTVVPLVDKMLSLCTIPLL